MYIESDIVPIGWPIQECLGWPIVFQQLYFDFNTCRCFVCDFCGVGAVQSALKHLCTANSGTHVAESISGIVRIGRPIRKYEKYAIQQEKHAI